MKCNIKIHILFDFVDGAWGGGNQFLKAIRDYLVKNEVYANDCNDADVILINSHHNLIKAAQIKFRNRNIIFIHRIDGPIYFYRDDGYLLDKLIFKSNKILVDGTIFQSNYTKNASLKRGLQLNYQFNKIIINAPNPKIFYKKPNSKNKKIKLIATSWSGNIKKGFDVYQWLDNHLDFNKYEMVFIGNSPIKFNNIIHKKSMDSRELASELRSSDVFIFASKIESCSNSLLEALHCGLPTIAFDGSSNSEIVKDGGELFNEPEKIPSLLEKIIANYAAYQKNIQLPSLEQVGESYFKFMENVFLKSQQGKYFPKKISCIDYLNIKKKIIWWRSKQRIIGLKCRLKLGSK